MGGATHSILAARRRPERPAVDWTGEVRPGTGMQDEKV